MKHFKTSLFFIIILTTTAFARPGDLDSSFGINGKIEFFFGDKNTNAFFWHFVLLNDGRIIVLSHIGIDPENYSALSRHKENGFLDSTFGKDGTLIYPDIDLNIWDEVIYPLNDGKLLLYLDTRDTIFLYRFNSDGSPDTTFNMTGRQILDSKDKYTGDLIIQPDGKLILSKNYWYDKYSTKTKIYRFYPDGSPDHGFNNSGELDLNTGTKYSEIKFIANQGKKLILMGWIGDSSGKRVSLRLNEDGSIDSSFGDNGIADIPHVIDNQIICRVIVQPDNKILITGEVYQFPGNSSSKMFLQRFESNGTIDNGFGVNGYVTNFNLDFPQDLHLYTTVYHDGKIYSSCFIEDSGAGLKQFYGRMIVLRYHDNGTLDSSFGKDGLVEIPYKNCSTSGQIKIQEDKILFCQAISDGWKSGYLLMRIIMDLDLGYLDNSYDNSMLLIYPNPINKFAKLSYSLKERDLISIDLFDLSGRKITTFIKDQFREPGNQSEILNFEDTVPPGSYMLIISSSQKKVSIKIEID